MSSNTEYYGQPGQGWRRFTRRSVLFPIFGLLIAGICGWVLFSIAGNRGDRETDLDAAIKAADNAFLAGKFEDSLSQLEEAADKAKTKDEKITVYTSLAASAASAGRISEAIEYMKKKHALKPDAADNDAYLLGSYYERANDIDAAVKQYKKALTYYKSMPEDAGNQATVANLEARLQSLGQ
jgi:tetratricopeptide (TPR) repeat protein